MESTGERLFILIHYFYYVLCVIQDWFCLVWVGKRCYLTSCSFEASCHTNLFSRICVVFVFVFQIAHNVKVVLALVYDSFNKIFPLIRMRISYFRSNTKMNRTFCFLNVLKCGTMSNK